MPTLITKSCRSLLPGLLLLAAACDYKVPEKLPTASGEEMFQLCSQCHGMAGEGHREYNAPSIAGLPQWYIERQLKKFKSGVRGTHPSDVAGMMMRPMTRTFHNDGDLEEVAVYVSRLNRPVARHELSGGNADHGKQLYAVCSACHLPDGAGQQQLNAPPLKNASDWYLLAQLEKFRAGMRGATTADVEGAAMRPQAVALADDQAMKDVVAYIATLK
jgi:cytochrome c553